MLSSTVLSVGAFAMGLVQGYLSVPTFFGSAWLARRATSSRPGMGRHAFSRIVTSVIMALGLVLAHGALAIAWLGRLASLAATRELALGRYWGVAVFAGMVLFAFMPTRTADGPGLPRDNGCDHQEHGSG